METKQQQKTAFRSDFTAIVSIYYSVFSLENKSNFCSVVFFFIRAAAFRLIEIEHPTQLKRREKNRGEFVGIWWRARASTNTPFVVRRTNAKKSGESFHFICDCAANLRGQLRIEMNANVERLRRFFGGKCELAAEIHSKYELNVSSCRMRLIQTDDSIDSLLRINSTAQRMLATGVRCPRDSQLKNKTENIAIHKMSRRNVNKTRNTTAATFDIGFRVWNTEVFIYLVEISCYFLFSSRSTLFNYLFEFLRELIFCIECNRIRARRHLIVYFAVRIAMRS